MFNPFQVPFLNTLLLLRSGVSVTFIHYSMLNKHYFDRLIGFNITIFLAILFSIFQIFEYNIRFFSINDSVFGSVFFIMTGFHGFHVLVGTFFLIVCFLRLLKVIFLVTII